MFCVQRQNVIENLQYICCISAPSIDGLEDSLHLFILLFLAGLNDSSAAPTSLGSELTAEAAESTSQAKRPVSTQKKLPRNLVCGKLLLVYIYVSTNEIFHFAMV